MRFCLFCGIGRETDRHSNGFAPTINRALLEQSDGRVTVLSFRAVASSRSERHNLHGPNPNLSRLQIKAAGANFGKPTAARSICDDGFPGSFRRAYPANQTWRLDFRSSAGRLAARQVELGRVRGAPSDYDQEGYSLRYQMVETRYDLARRDIRRFIAGGRPQGATRFLHHGSLRRGLHNKRPRRGSHWG